MKCPKCGRQMMNLGNIDNQTYCSLPPQWDITYVCHNCKCKKKRRVYGHQEPIYSYVENYEEIKDEKQT